MVAAIKNFIYVEVGMTVTTIASYLPAVDNVFRSALDQVPQMFMKDGKLQQANVVSVEGSALTLPYQNLHS